MKVKYTADFLQLPYEWVPIDVTKGESRTPEFLSMNPAGQVPVVELDDGRVLSQSNAIIRFLADATSLLPKDSFDRAKVDELLFWEQYSHEPYIAVARFWLEHLEMTPEREAALAEKKVQGYKALDVMEGHLSDRDWFVDDSMSIADIALYAYTHVADEGGFDLAPYPAIRGWIARIASAPGYCPITQK